MKIPKSFEMQGRTIRVANVESINDAYGTWEALKDLITIDASSTKHRREATFLHEFFHAALEALGREDLSQDEKLVDGLSGLMHQMLKTGK